MNLIFTKKFNVSKIGLQDQKLISGLEGNITKGVGRKFSNEKKDQKLAKNTKK